MDNPWRILEFYSGIGGIRYSLMRAGINGVVIEAFDINDTANDVYEHNFGHRPFQGNIQCLGAVELDKYRADAWLLCPPCQPYTRQGLQKHSADTRAFSFIKIIELIHHMLQPPKMLFVENVVGFETSDTHEHMLEIFGKLGFVTQEFILSPLQFGIPYSRPRYFCLAKRKPLSFQNSEFNYQLQRTTAMLLTSDNILLKNEPHFQDGREEESFIQCEPIRNFLEMEILYNHPFEGANIDAHGRSNVCMVDCGDGITATATKGLLAKNMENTSEDQSVEEVERCGLVTSVLDRYMVPPSLIERWGSAMDIVFPDSNRCCCFTKSYYRYVKGTGSLLATSKICKYGSTSKPDVHSLKVLGLRYFTPREVANLHSFPKDFHFPDYVCLAGEQSEHSSSSSFIPVFIHGTYVIWKEPLLLKGNYLNSA